MMRLLTTFLAVVLAVGCHEERPRPASASLEVLTGVVIRKEWSKSYESWNAGGSEYYVLEIENPESLPSKRMARQVVVLRPSASVPFERFADVVGKRIRCRGVFVPGAPYTPSKDSVEQMPSPVTDPMTGKAAYPIRGSGFQVHSIEL